MGHTWDTSLMLVPLVTMAVAQFFDFGTFVVMVQRHGSGAEANPFVTGLLDELGLPATALAKIALVTLVVAVATLLAHRSSSDLHRRIAGLVVGAAIVAGLIGGGSNALTIGLI
jgi:hypothetical protein